MRMTDATRQLDRCLDELRSGHSTPSSREEIVATIEGVLTNLGADFGVADGRLYQELEALARFIEVARSEIAEVRPQEINAQHIPVATDELDAIVTATEEATSTILDSVEGIETLAKDLDPAIRDRIEEAATRIYEACSFQDITGQRISKVVMALKHIEEKIDALVNTFGDEIRKASANDGEPAAQPDTDEVDILEGPQLPGDGISQEDIDALLAAGK